MQTLLDHKVHRDAGPLENVFILVDDELFGSMITAGYRAIPFFERDGYYLGTTAGRHHHDPRTRAAAVVRSDLYRLCVVGLLVGR